MKFEDRVADMKRTMGSTIFMKAIDVYDDHEQRHGAWLLTFGLLDTFKIIKGISEDGTF